MSDEKKTNRFTMRKLAGWAGAICCSLATVMMIGCQPTTLEGKLARAIRMGRLSEIKELMEGGVDVTQDFDNGSTGLHLMAKLLNPSAEVAAFLIDKGVDVDAQDSDGQTAWSLAWSCHQNTVNRDKARFLVEILNAGFQPPRPSGDDGSTYLHTLASNCKSAVLVKRLVIEEELESVDDNGWTPLHYAAFAGNYEAADGLLLAGANPNAETTKMVFETYLKGETTMFRFRYEAGSRPVDLYHRSHTRLTKDFKALLEKHGGSSNPDVDNRFPR